MISAYKFDDIGLPYSQIVETQTKLSNGMPYVLTASFLMVLGVGICTSSYDMTHLETVPGA